MEMPGPSIRPVAGLLAVVVAIIGGSQWMGVAPVDGAFIGAIAVVAGFGMGYALIGFAKWGARASATWLDTFRKLLTLPALVVCSTMLACFSSWEATDAVFLETPAQSTPARAMRVAIWWVPILVGMWRGAGEGEDRPVDSLRRRVVRRGWFSAILACWAMVAWRGGWQGHAPWSLPVLVPGAFGLLNILGGIMVWRRHIGA